MMRIENEKAKNVLSLLRRVCEVMAEAEPGESHEYKRMADEPYHCDGFPAALIIATIIADHLSLFRDNDEILTTALRLLCTDYRLPMMADPDTAAHDGVGESADEP